MNSTITRNTVSHDADGCSINGGTAFVALDDAGDDMVFGWNTDRSVSVVQAIALLASLVARVGNDFLLSGADCDGEVALLTFKPGRGSASAQTVQACLDYRGGVRSDLFWLSWGDDATSIATLLESLRATEAVRPGLTFSHLSNIYRTPTLYLADRTAASADGIRIGTPCD